MEQYTQLPKSRADVLSPAEDIRIRLSQALRLVDEIGAQSIRGREERVTERYVQKLLGLRRKRDQFFGSELFADPAWDILLELYAAELGQRRLSVSSLGVGAAVPPTTALRWIKTLEKKGMIRRTADPFDGRRVFVALTPESVHTLDEFFASVPSQALLL